MFGSQEHGFKPGVAVIKHKTLNVWFVTFGFEVLVSPPLLLMVVHGEWQAKRQVCRWSISCVV